MAMADDGKLSRALSRGRPRVIYARNAMVYMLFSIACAMGIIGLVGTGRLHAGDPRVGLLLVGNLSFIE